MKYPTHIHPQSYFFFLNYHYFSVHRFNC